MTDQKQKKLPNPSPAPNHAATRPPGTCGCAPRVHSGLPPGEDRTSNLVGPVRGVIWLGGRRRLIRAVRHLGGK